MIQRIMVAALFLLSIGTASVTSADEGHDQHQEKAGQHQDMHGEKAQPQEMHGEHKGESKGEKKQAKKTQKHKQGKP